MAFGFDTGSTWLDRYYEVYYEIIAAYYDALGDVGGIDYVREYLKPAIQAVITSTKGLYDTPYYNNYYENYYKDYFSVNSLEQIFSGYDVKGVDVDEILRKWGFSGGGAVGGGAAAESADGVDLLVPKKYDKKNADNITDFNPRRQDLLVNADDWGLGSDLSFRSASSSKMIKKMAATGADFIYQQKPGALYFNANGSDPGFGDGGLCAIFKGSPALTEADFVLV